MATWLENVNVLELSAVRHPANRKRKLFQKSKSQTSTEETMVTEQQLSEYLEKSALPAEVQKFVKSAIEALGKSKGGMSEEMFSKASKALADVLGFGGKPDETAKVQKALEDAEAKRTSLIEIVKSAVASLQAPTPLVNDAVNALAELAGVTPVVKQVEGLTPELKAQWTELQKTADANRAELEKLQKSIDADREDMALRETFTKAQLELSHVPLATDELAGLIRMVQKSDAKAGETLLTLLRSVDELVAKSDLMHDLGGSGRLPVGPRAALSKIAAAAKSLTEKSATEMTPEQAMT